MLQSAESMRKNQKKACESYKLYVEMKDKITKLIYFAAHVGKGECVYEVRNSEQNYNNVNIISKELAALGYGVAIVRTVEEIRMNIVWDCR